MFHIRTVPSADALNSVEPEELIYEFSNLGEKIETAYHQCINYIRMPCALPNRSSGLYFGAFEFLNNLMDVRYDHPIPTTNHRICSSSHQHSSRECHASNSFLMTVNDRGTAPSLETRIKKKSWTMLTDSSQMRTVLSPDPLKRVLPSMRRAYTTSKCPL